MQARYYDPVIGRFYSNDPVDAATFINQGNVQGFNRYTYANNNNPYKYTDPTGENPFAIIGGIAGFFRALSAVYDSNASFTDKALAVTAGTLIGAATGGRATGAITAVTSKFNGFVSGVAGATSSKDGLNAVTTIVTETVLQTGSALASEETPSPPEVKEEN